MAIRLKFENKSPIISSDGINHGEIIKLRKKIYISNGKTIRWKEINLSQMVGKYFLITATKLEFVHDKNVVTIDTA